jgi:hypothetical protein
VYFAHTAGGRMIGKKVNPFFWENDKLPHTMSNPYFGMIIYTVFFH